MNTFAFRKYIYLVTLPPLPAGSVPEPKEAPYAGIVNNRCRKKYSTINVQMGSLIVDIFQRRCSA